MRHKKFFRAAAALSGILLMATAGHADVSRSQQITPNFKDAEISQIAEAVSAATGKTFVIHPSVKAQVTLLTAKPMSPDAFYEAFLSILQVHGFVAMPAGDVIKIVPDSNARLMPSNDGSQPAGGSDEIVTQVIDVKNVSAAQLVPLLRPLIPQYGHLAAYQPANVLIVSDRANNVDRIVRIIRRVDQAGDQTIEIVPLHNASAAEVVRVVNTLQPAQQGTAEGGASPVKVVADDRSNSVLMGGDVSQRLRLRALVAMLDTPLETGGDTQVRYLKFADAEKLATKLKEQITGIAQAATGPGASGQAASPQAVADKGAMIWADAETNSIVVTAPPKLMKAVMSIVDKLDIRRAQVLVEAVIVEVSADKTSDLGVNWASWSEDSDGNVIPGAAFLGAVGGSTAADLYSAIKGLSSDSSSSSSSSTSALNGTTIGAAVTAANGINYGAVLRAIQGDANNNIVATPSAVTMDNQEAELKIAQEVPFVTGSYTSSASTSTNPFTTVQRQEVGTILKVTPQIAAEGNLVALKISIESSSVASTSVSSVDITTNKRTVSTSVLIEDGGIIVLGGLIQDSASRSEQRVPLLGNIPIIGFAFKARDTSSKKSNLMIFIRPKILRDGTQTAFATGAKYNYMLNEQKKADPEGKLPLLPGVKPPSLEALPAP